MIVVSDTTPIISLLKCQRLEIEKVKQSYILMKMALTF